MEEKSRCLTDSLNHGDRVVSQGGKKQLELREQFTREEKQYRARTCVFSQSTDQHTLMRKLPEARERNNPKGLQKHELEITQDCEQCRQKKKTTLISHKAPTQHTQKSLASVVGDNWFYVKCCSGPALLILKATPRVHKTIPK